MVGGMFRATFPDAEYLLDLFRAVNAVAEPILMQPMPRKTTMANILYRLVYNLMRVALMLFIIAPLLSPIIFLAPQYRHIALLGGATA